MVDVDCDDEGNVGEVNVVVVQSATEDRKRRSFFALGTLLC